MNWAAVAAIISGCTLLIVLIGGGAMWGTLTEKVRGHSKRLDSHKLEIVRIDSVLTEHSIELAKLQEWKDGYNAAARVGRTAELADRG